MSEPLLDLTVIGLSTLKDLTVNGVSILETVQVRGQATIDSLTVNNTSTFENVVTFNKNVIFNGGIFQSGDNEFSGLNIVNTDKSSGVKLKIKEVGNSYSMYFPNALSSGKYLISNKTDSGTIELEWYLHPTTIFIEDFILKKNTFDGYPFENLIRPATTEISFSKFGSEEYSTDNVQILTRVDNGTTPIRLNVNDLRFGILEVKQNGKVFVKSDSSEEFTFNSDFKETEQHFDTIITFRVKPKFIHNLRVESSTLGNISQITPNSIGEILIVDGVYDDSTGSITVGQTISGMQKTYLAVGGEDGAPLRWKLRENNSVGKCFFGILDNFGFTIDVFGNLRQANVESCVNELSNQCVNPHGAIGHRDFVFSTFEKTTSSNFIETADIGRSITLDSEYTYDCDNSVLTDVKLQKNVEKQIIDGIPYEFAENSSIAIFASGSDTPFVVPNSFINLNIVIIGNTVKFKINDFIVSEMNVNSNVLNDIIGKSVGVKDKRKICVQSNYLNMYVDLIKISQFKDLNDNIFGDDRNIK